MRIWTLSPEYLDPKGLVALWRETLLAKQVLSGQTKGYKNHPQLNRFKAFSEPILAIDKYLEAVHKEATKRNYNFDQSKFDFYEAEIKIPVTEGQVAYELEHLGNKLINRAPELLIHLPKEASKTKLSTIFTMVPGGVEDWEIR